MQAIRLDEVRKRVQAGQVFTWRDLLVLVECSTERQKVANLTEAIGVPKPSVTRVVAALEDQPQPLLKHVQDPDDRRSPWIEITPAGRKFLSSLMVVNAPE